MPKSEQAAQAVPEAVAVDEAQGGLVSDFGSSSDNQQPSDEGFEKLMRG